MASGRRMSGCAVKLLLLGAPRTGKSAFFTTVVKRPGSAQYKATRAVDLGGQYTDVHGKQTRITLLDSSGMDGSVARNLSMHFPTSNGFILFYNPAVPDTWATLRALFEEHVVPRLEDEAMHRLAIGVVGCRIGSASDRVVDDAAVAEWVALQAADFPTAVFRRLEIDGAEDLAHADVVAFPGLLMEELQNAADAEDGVGQTAATAASTTTPESPEAPAEGISITVLGGREAGKTAFCNVLQQQLDRRSSAPPSPKLSRRTSSLRTPALYTASVGTSRTTLRCEIDTCAYDLKLCDGEGRAAAYKILKDSEFPSCRAFLVVYNVEKAETFHRAKQVFQEVQEFKAAREEGGAWQCVVVGMHFAREAVRCVSGASVAKWAGELEAAGHAHISIQDPMGENAAAVVAAAKYLAAKAAGARAVPEVPQPAVLWEGPELPGTVDVRPRAVTPVATPAVGPEATEPAPPAAHGTSVEQPAPISLAVGEALSEVHAAGHAGSPTLAFVQETLVGAEEAPAADARPLQETVMEKEKEKDASDGEPSATTTAPATTEPATEAPGTRVVTDYGSAMDLVPQGSFQPAPRPPTPSVALFDTRGAAVAFVMGRDDEDDDDGSDAVRAAAPRASLPALAEVLAVCDGKVPPAAATPAATRVESTTAVESVVTAETPAAGDVTATRTASLSPAIDLVPQGSFQPALRSPTPSVALFETSGAAVAFVMGRDDEDDDAARAAAPCASLPALAGVLAVCDGKVPPAAAAPTATRVESTTAVESVITVETPAAGDVTATRTASLSPAAAYDAGYYSDYNDSALSFIVDTFKGIPALQEMRGMLGDGVGAADEAPAPASEPAETTTASTPAPVPPGSSSPVLLHHGEALTFMIGEEACPHLSFLMCAVMGTAAESAPAPAPPSASEPPAAPAAAAAAPDAPPAVGAMLTPAAMADAVAAEEALPVVQLSRPSLPPVNYFPTRGDCVAFVSTYFACPAIEALTKQPPPPQQPEGKDEKKRDRTAPTERRPLHAKPARGIRTLLACKKEAGADPAAACPNLTVMYAVIRQVRGTGSRPPSGPNSANGDAPRIPLLNSVSADVISNDSYYPEYDDVPGHRTGFASVQRYESDNITISPRSEMGMSKSVTGVRLELETARQQIQDEKAALASEKAALEAEKRSMRERSAEKEEVMDLLTQELERERQKIRELLAERDALRQGHTHAEQQLEDTGRQAEELSNKTARLESERAVMEEQTTTAQKSAAEHAQRQKVAESDRQRVAEENVQLTTVQDEAMKYAKQKEDEAAAAKAQLAAVLRASQAALEAHFANLRNTLESDEASERAEVSADLDEEYKYMTIAFEHSSLEIIRRSVCPPHSPARRALAETTDAMDYQPPPETFTFRALVVLDGTAVAEELSLSWGCTYADVRQAAAKSQSFIQNFGVFDERFRFVAIGRAGRARIKREAEERRVLRMPFVRIHDFKDDFVTHFSRAFNQRITPITKTNKAVWEARYECEERPYGFTLPIIRVAADPLTAATWNGLGKQPSGFHPRVCDALGHSPLHQAVRVRNMTAVQACLKAGCSPTLRDVWGRTPVAIAACNDDVDILRTLCDVPHSRASLAGDNQGETPLHHAVKHGRLDAVALLLRYSCDPHAHSLVNYRTPLHLAVGAGAFDILNVIVDNPSFDLPDLVETPDIVRRVRGTLFMWTPEPLLQTACGLPDERAARMVEYLFKTRVEDLGLEERINDPFARAVGEAGVEEITRGGVPTDTLSRAALPRRVVHTGEATTPRRLVKNDSFLRNQTVLRVESRSAVIAAAHTNKPALLDMLITLGAKHDRKIQGWVGWDIPSHVHVVEAAVYEGNTDAARVLAAHLLGPSRSTIHPVCFAVRAAQKHPFAFERQDALVAAALDIERGAPQFACPLVQCEKLLTSDRARPPAPPVRPISSAVAEAIFTQDDRLLVTLLQMCPGRASDLCVGLPESAAQPGTTYFASPLWVACCVGSTSAVDALLSSGADPERGLFAIPTEHAAPPHLAGEWKREPLAMAGCYGVGLLDDLHALRTTGWIPKQHPAAHQTAGELRANRAACFNIVVRNMRGKQFVQFLKRDVHMTLTNAFTLQARPLLLLAVAGRDRALYTTITTHGHFKAEGSFKHLAYPAEYILEALKGEYSVAWAKELLAYQETHSGAALPWEACLRILRAVCLGDIRQYNAEFFDVSGGGGVGGVRNAWGSTAGPSPFMMAGGARPGTTISLSQAGLDYYSTISSPPRTADMSAAGGERSPSLVTAGGAGGRSGVGIWGGTGLSGFASVPIQASTSFVDETHGQPGQSPMHAATESHSPHNTMNLSLGATAWANGSGTMSMTSPGGANRPLSTLTVLPAISPGGGSPVKRAPPPVGAANKHIVSSWYFNALARGQMAQFWCGALKAALARAYGEEWEGEAVRLVTDMLPRVLRSGDVIGVSELMVLLPRAGDAGADAVYRQVVNDPRVTRALAVWPLRHVPEECRLLMQHVRDPDALLHTTVAHAPPAAVAALVDLYLTLHPYLVERLDQPVPQKVTLPGVWSVEALTPVHVACVRGLLDVLKAMIARGAKCTHLDASEDHYVVDDSSPRPGSRSPEYASLRRGGGTPAGRQAQPRGQKHVTKFRFSMGRYRRPEEATLQQLRRANWCWAGAQMKPSDAALDRLREARWSWWEKQRVVGLSPLQYLTPLALAQTSTFIKKDTLMGGRIFHSVVSATKPFFSSLLDECGLLMHPKQYRGEALPPMLVTSDDHGERFFDPRGLSDEDVATIGQQRKADETQLDSLAARYVSTVKKPNKDLLEILNKKGAQIDVLDLSSSYLGPKSMAFLLNELLPELPKLSTLNLKSCQVGNSDVKMLYKNAVGHPSLTSLDLSHNPDIYLDGGIKLRLLKQRNPRIAHIGLDCTGVSPSLIQSIEGTQADNTIPG